MNRVLCDNSFSRMSLLYFLIAASLSKLRIFFVPTKLVSLSQYRRFTFPILAINMSFTRYFYAYWATQINAAICKRFNQNFGSVTG